MLSSLLETRLSRYAIAAGAVVAAIPTQAAPVTVILPTPIDVRNGLMLNIDGVGSAELFFTGAGSSLGFVGFIQPGAIAATAGVVRQLLTGVQLFSADSFSLWGPGNSFSQVFNTSPSPTFLGVGFATTNGGYNRLAFLQFDGPLLYGYAWEQASSITTFDLRGSSSEVPEPATGALAALALGALAVAARKRKQA
jgi:hypothetical protein